MIKRWSLTKFLIVFSVLFFPANIFSQNPETTRSFAYDRGLLNASEPFAPTGNPALVSLKDNLRFNLEYYHTEVDNYSLSLLYPLSSSTGLGIYYSSRYNDNVFNLSSGVFEVIQRNQSFLISLGHDYLFRFGQQIEVDFDLNRYSTIYTTDDETIPFSNDQLFNCSYRFGFYRQIFDNLTFGFLTPPLFQFQYQSFIASDTTAKSTWYFWHESSQRTNLPLMAVEWKAFNNLNIAFSNRTKSGRDNFQIASEFRIKNFILTSAVTQHDKSKEPNYIFGLGSYYKGIELFSAYDIKNKGFAIAASFAPERRKGLIVLKNIEVSANPLYPYRMSHQNQNLMATVTIENVTEHPVELTINLKGRHLPALLKSVVLDRRSISSIRLPYPSGLKDIKAGNYIYSMEILAYHRGRQTINDALSFEMKDKHDWSGDPADLAFFITPENEQMINKATNIIANYSHQKNRQNPITIAETFYRFIADSITYICDPLHSNHERIQYPLELLKTKCGDCEDLSILMVTLLRSVGISASFIEIIEPSISKGHIFVLFDTQQDVSEIIAKNHNLQNYIIRQSNTGRSKVFMPIELTKSEFTFREAWRFAIDIYHTKAIQNNGLTTGLVKFIDLD